MKCVFLFGCSAPEAVPPPYGSAYDIPPPICVSLTTGETMSPSFLDARCIFHRASLRPSPVALAVIRLRRGRFGSAAHQNPNGIPNRLRTLPRICTPPGPPAGHRSALTDATGLTRPQRARPTQPDPKLVATHRPDNSPRARKSGPAGLCATATSKTRALADRRRDGRSGFRLASRRRIDHRTGHTELAHSLTTARSAGRG